MRVRSFFVFTTFVILSTACDRGTAPIPQKTVLTETKASPEGAPIEGDSKPPPVDAQQQAVRAPTAAIGKEAPAFSLPDLSGKTHSLADYRGKSVVLEWFNPECPFVKAAHTKGSLVRTAFELEKKGFVYLAINSGAPGKQGYGNEVNTAGKESLGFTHPILLDESGAIGKAYGATNTPHIFVINSKGTLVYAGAIDNSPDGEGKSPEGGTLVNYLTQAAEELLAGKPVSIPSTKAYGCGVKYAG